MKTVLILGGNSGMGKASAIELALKNYRVLIHGRDPVKTLAAMEEIIKVSGNKNVDSVSGDLSTIAGMRATSAVINNKTEVIDSLILSTGVIMPKRVETADGLETMFATQYLARFGMTQLLLPLLKRSELARIVHVGAKVIGGAKVYFDNISLKDSYSMIRAMKQSMFCNHLFIQEFAKRNSGSNMMMNMMQVGIAKTEVARNVSFLFRLAMSVFGRSAKAASKNIVHLADAGSVNYSGYFLPNPRRTDKKEKILHDESIASKLWETSMQLLNS